MHKQLYAVILFTTVFCFKGFGQAFPPIINTYSDSVGNTYANLFISFSPNDTGTIQANIVLQKGQGNSVYDSTYTFTASDSANYEFQLDSLSPCTTYQVLTIMSNDRTVGLQSNPLLVINTLCTAGISPVSANSFSMVVQPQSVEIKADEIPQNAHIDIYDLTGRQILTTSFNQSVQQIPFNQNAGIYLLRITGGGQTLYTNRFAIF